MRFFDIVLSGAAMIAAVAAQATISVNEFPQSGVEAGKTYTITYSPKDQVPTEIILRRGPSGNLDVVGTIGTATGGSFSWTVDSKLANAPNYAIEISRGGQNINYSGQFGLTGGSGSLSSASASASGYSASVSSAVASAKSSASSVAASASSVVASLISSASTAAASASIMPSNSINGTVSTPTLSRTSGAPTASKTGSPPESTGAASALENSPMALIFGAVAAIAYLH